MIYKQSITVFQSSHHGMHVVLNSNRRPWHFEQSTPSSASPFPSSAYTQSFSRHPSYTLVTHSTTSSNPGGLLGVVRRPSSVEDNVRPEPLEFSTGASVTLTWPPPNRLRLILRHRRTRRPRVAGRACVCPGTAQGLQLATSSIRLEGARAPTACRRRRPSRASLGYAREVDHRGVARAVHDVECDTAEGGEREQRPPAVRSCSICRTSASACG